MPGIGELLIIAILIFPLTIFWIWMTVDCATKMPNDDPSKKSWIIWLCLFSMFAAAVYYFGPRSRRIKKEGNSTRR